MKFVINERDKCSLCLTHFVSFLLNKGQLSIMNCKSKLRPFIFVKYYRSSRKRKNECLVNSQ